MPRRKHHLSVRFDGRTGSALQRAACQDDRTVSQQIQRYVRKGLTADGYWEEPIQPASECPESSDEGGSSSES